MAFHRMAVAGAVAVAALLLIPVAGAAHGHGGHPFHHGFHRHFLSAWPYYGGYVVAPDYAPAQSYLTSTRVIYVPEPPQALSCHHSVQTITVPAEAGGTRTVTVTRC